MKRFHFPALLGLLLLVSCGKETTPYQPPVPKTPETPLFKDERQALEKTKDVQKIMDERVGTLEKTNDP